jgi:hypothetical protein
LADLTGETASVASGSLLRASFLDARQIAQVLHF